MVCSRTVSPALAALLRASPWDCQVIAIVSAVDHEGTCALLERQAQLPGLATVVMEGFGAGDDKTGAAERLRSAGVPTVVCRQGHIDEAISALEGVGGAPRFATRRSEGRRSRKHEQVLIKT